MPTRQKRLSRKDIETLAGILVDSNKNVFVEINRVFGNVLVGVEIFTQMQRIGGIFKCEHCDFWLGMLQLDRTTSAHVCKKCMEATV